MAEISAQLVKELREKTGAGMMDCKNALSQADDFEGAVKLLREKGLAKALKKESRIAAEGLIASLVEGQAAVMVELNCETDFVARNDDFKNFLKTCAKLALEKGQEGNDVDGKTLLSSTFSSGNTLESLLNEKIATIGEKITLRRYAKLKGGSLYGEYIHGGGNIGVLVEFSLSDIKGLNDQTIKQAAKDVAMHVAAVNPAFIKEEEIPESFKEKERQIFKAQVLAEGKPENMVDKIIAGKMGKHLKDMCLLEQPFVKNPDISIKDMLKEVSQKSSVSMSISKVVRFKVGEGIEKPKEDFAEEVKKMTM